MSAPCRLDLFTNGCRCEESVNRKRKRQYEYNYLITWNRISSYMLLRWSEIDEV